MDDISASKITISMINLARLYKKMRSLPKKVSFFRLAKLAYTNMRKHLFLKNFFGIPALSQQRMQKDDIHQIYFARFVSITNGVNARTNVQFKSNNIEGE